MTEFSEHEIKQLLQQVEYFVPGSRQKFVYGRLARKALSLNRKRIRAQQNTDGSSFEKRKSGGRQKMLKRILRGKPRAQTRVQLQEKSATLEAVNPVAKKHHYGSKRTIYAERNHAKLRAHLLKKKAKKGEPTEVLTPKQIQALKQEVGFKKSKRV